MKKCPMCDGEKRIQRKTTIKTCPKCDGSGVYMDPYDYNKILEYLEKQKDYYDTVTVYNDTTAVYNSGKHNAFDEIIGLLEG